MNITRFGDAASDMYPNDPIKAESLRKKLAIAEKVSHVNDVVVTTANTMPPGSTVEQINEVVQKVLNKTSEKPKPYAMYAALAVGAYLIFK